MINAKDLRIGNYVYPNSENATPYPVIAILEDNIVCSRAEHSFQDDTIIPYKDLLPIPLTEEILLKCGFTKSSDGNYYKDGKFTIYNRFGNYGLIGGSLSWNEFKYLHQLQNLYWCLCGEELNYTP